VSCANTNGDAKKAKRTRAPNNAVPGLGLKKCNMGCLFLTVCLQGLAPVETYDGVFYSVGLNTKTLTRLPVLALP
jgi:hypothetical protein